MIKYADDTAIVGLVSQDENKYRKTVSDFYKWCSENYLLLNLDKTKEMIIDFRKKHNELFDLKINNKKIEQSSIYKYLGVTINNKLSWSDNCQILYKKILQRLLCLIGNYNYSTSITPS